MGNTAEKLDESIRLGVLTTRALPVTPDTYDENTRSIEVGLASDEIVEVYDVESGQVIREVLLTDGAELPERVPLLDTHNRKSIRAVIGSLRNFKKENGLIVARAHFSDDEDGRLAESKVRDGHVTDLSAGYRITEKRMLVRGEEETINGRTLVGPLRIGLRWKVREGSLTSIGADEKTKVRSTVITDETRDILIERGLPEDASHEETINFLNDQLSNNSQQSRGDTQMGEDNKKQNNTGSPPVEQQRQEIDVNQVREEARRQEAERISEINATADQFGDKVSNVRELANKAVKEAWDIARFNQEILKRMSTGAPVDVDRDDSRQGHIGMTEKEIKKYSIVEGIRQIAFAGKTDGLIKEASEAMQQVTGREANGFLVPDDVLYYQDKVKVSDNVARQAYGEYHRAYQMQQRDAMTPTEFAHGGAFIGTSVLAGSFIEMLRNKPLVAQMGARRLTGLTGNVAIPKQTGGATAYWLAAGAQVPKSRQTVGQLPLTPKRLVANTEYDKQLVIQSSIGVEAFVRDDLLTVLSLARDLAAIQSDGANGEPIGVMHTPGVNTVEFGATASRAKAIEFQRKVAEENAHRGALGYITTPVVAAAWMAIEEAANTAQWLWKGNIDTGMVVGRPAESTNQVPDDKVIYGNWNDLILADWAGIDIVVDPYSGRREGEIGTTITLWADQGVRHAKSFAVSTDSGAQ